MYKNGATADPLVPTINPPKMTIMTKIGTNQYFLRDFKYDQSSLRKDMTFLRTGQEMMRGWDLAALA